MKFYITGISGVGKSTVSKELNKRGILSYDMDSIPNLCHWRNKLTLEMADYQSGIGKDWLEAHEWICNTEHIKKLLNNSKDVVLVGIASNQDEYLNIFDKIFLLHCKKEIFLHRLTTRDGDNDFAKDKSEQKQILSWYEDYERKMLKRGAIAINTEDPINIVVNKIATKIQLK